MNRKLFVLGFLLASASLTSVAQNTIKDDFNNCVTAKTFNYFDAGGPNLMQVTPPPPTLDKRTVDGELVELHRIEQTRTKGEVDAARHDADELDIFIFRTVLGGNFDGKALKDTRKLSLHVCQDATVLATTLKNLFDRPRPYLVDEKDQLHPVCDTQSLTHSPSYPSGHSITGYLEALTLAEIVPEKRYEILERANDYAHNRMVCGVHYSSDIVAGHMVAYALFDQMKASPKFQEELAAARAETRTRLGLNLSK